MAIPVLIGSPPAKNSLTYRSLNINNAADDEKDTFLIEDVSESPVWQQGIEPFPDRDGAQTYEPFDLFRVFRFRGWVYAPTLAALFDKIEEINEAFNPVKAYLADTDSINRGYMPLTFNVPTADTSTYPTGLIACVYYVQALGVPVVQISKFAAFAGRIDFMVRAADPRRYFTDTQSESRIGDGTITADNTDATYPSFPVIQIDTGGSVSGTWTIARTTPTGGTVSIDSTQLDTSSTYYLDLQAGTLLKSTGADASDALVATSTFFDIAAGVSNTITVASTSGSPTITVLWARAFI